MATEITNRIIDKINIIKDKENGNKEFIKNVQNGVSELNSIVIELLNKLNGHITLLDGKITQFQSNQQQIEKLKNEKDELIRLLNEVKDQMTSGRETDANEQNKSLTERINSLTENEKNLQQQIQQLQTENAALKEQINNLNSNLISIEKALNDLDDTFITEQDKTSILTIIEQIKEAIRTFKQGKQYLTGGRRKRGRKFVTRKMKKGMKKGMMMRGGYIADYKPKTHRRQKDKKRSSSMRRGKKQRYTTSSSRLTTTSSY